MIWRVGLEGLDLEQDEPEVFDAPDQAKQDGLVDEASS
jgi:hypothetical protein